MIKVVADTNILISGMLWSGTPRRILRAADEERIILFSSKGLLEELAYVLKKPKLQTALARNGTNARQALAQAVSLVHLVIPRTFEDVIVTEDPSDDLVLACAATAAVDAIVSGDEHLLALKKFRGIPILSPAEFMRGKDYF